MYKEVRQGANILFCCPQWMQIIAVASAMNLQACSFCLNVFQYLLNLSQKNMHVAPSVDDVCFRFRDFAIDSLSKLSGYFVESKISLVIDMTSLLVLMFFFVFFIWL